jgi:hypothetical protein
LGDSKKQPLENYAYETKQQRKGTNKMTTQTAAEKRQDRTIALDILESVREEITSGNALLLINAELGKGSTDYFRALLTYTNKDGRTDSAHLTWAISKLFGYTLKDRNGFWCLAIGGGGFSKSDEIARSLANHYQIDRVRYERS